MKEVEILEVVLFIEQKEYYNFISHSIRQLHFSLKENKDYFGINYSISDFFAECVQFQFIFANDALLDSTILNITKEIHTALVSKYPLTSKYELTKDIIKNTNNPILSINKQNDTCIDDLFFESILSEFLIEFFYEKIEELNELVIDSVMLLYYAVLHFCVQKELNCMPKIKDHIKELCIENLGYNNYQALLIEVTKLLEHNPKFFEELTKCGTQRGTINLIDSKTTNGFYINLERSLINMESLTVFIDKIFFSTKIKIKIDDNTHYLFLLSLLKGALFE